MSEQTKNLLGGGYNPDVLECLANLSNDEVFTPPKVVNQMLDMLPPETWTNPNLTFLDPACKTGVFLREIAKRLIDGLADQIPNLQDRLDHIFQKQLYGIAITELTELASRRSLYCSKYANGKYSVTKFDNPDGNIRFVPVNHTWEGDKCKYCGASASQYQRDNALETHAYEFIHTNNPEEIFGMKFDVIIGNPPYQLNTASSSAQATPLYDKFVNLGRKMRPRFFSMIIPSRWFAGGMNLDSFRESMLNDKHIKNMTDYPDATKCFSGLVISGGVCYFLWDRDYTGQCEFTGISDTSTTTAMRPLDEFSVFVRYNEAVSIIHKTKSLHEGNIVSIASSLCPYGLGSAERGEQKVFDGALKLYSSKGIGYYDKEKLTQGKNYLSTYHVMISKAMSGHSGETGKGGKFKIISKLKVLNPNEICTFSYFLIGSFKSKEEAANCKSYLSTKFARFLLLQATSSINISKEKFEFVPMQDFSKPWTDEELYKKYNLSEEEISFIEDNIAPMGDN